MELSLQQLDHILFDLVWQLYVKHSSTGKVYRKLEFIPSTFTDTTYKIIYSDNVIDLFGFQFTRNDPRYVIKETETYQSVDITTNTNQLYHFITKK